MIQARRRAAIAIAMTFAPDLLFSITIHIAGLGSEAATQEVAMPEHFSDEQRGWLQERRALVGDARIREVEAEWPRLIAEVREEMTKGTPPDAPRAIALAQRWTSLVEEFTNGNLGIAKAVATRYSEEPALRQKTGIDSAMMDYISRAGAFRTLPRE